MLDIITCPHVTSGLPCRSLLEASIKQHSRPRDLSSLHDLACVSCQGLAYIAATWQPSRSNVIAWNKQKVPLVDEPASTKQPSPQTCLFTVSPLSKQHAASCLLHLCVYAAASSGNLARTDMHTPSPLHSARGVA